MNTGWKLVLVYWVLPIVVTAGALLAQGPYCGYKPEFSASSEKTYLRETEQVKLINKEIGGELEHPTFDRSRVDIITDKYAYEVDWADKWAEAVGQSLYYAAATEREPAIILLIKDREKERKYYLRCLVVCARHHIHLETWNAK